ncbi:MAG: Cysteine-tRNA ligase [Candidatus Moranbacteria bacterium GW2011_GWC2_37_73]|nr:MAG: cysteinyl-tRNA synthetase, cysteinyl-tRNA synthetase [Parcubacteria group bacterium GW2011_GWC1_36_108]KKQ00181.1 MAG: Cysteine-tRNA ligase [Candidatus Moranbacteria bacterium GW2011_GWD1_36_198]KKQ01314.1 MAG: Cysteine-tRNA ligase [Candidatus Moranbacteria bacterium GW2011_GWD2_36_198]KKQ39768.1 MAG: Cysteine-tRNA ligase [Candidatus Moranbacteria bacterium GW2011_GWC2_37_73]HAR99775.1 cysteine--tRNA ligase [Candidatus Moranbacteria bacterium]
MLSLYNTLSKTKQEFKSLNPGKVGMYTCGPTVYSYLHIGNIRAYLLSDTVRRYLEYIGYEVRLIKNITDVGHLTDDDVAQGDSGEDKMVKAAEREKKTPEEIARFYEEYFKQTEKELNIIPAHFFPRATAHVPQMIKIIEGLIEKGYAYEKNGNVFFDVTKFEDYGKLSGNTLENLKIGARIEEHPDKKNAWDFALWIKAPKEHAMKWESPWSVGYPGWHIECSAMSTEYLGNTIDIHTGGEDNIFPHQEAEIAQTECYTGQKFVNFWVHTRHLLIDGKKMSKSKGNLFTLEDIKEKGFSAMDLRLLFLSSHYRSQTNFSWEALEQAHKNIQRINDFVLNIEAIASRDLVSPKTIDTKAVVEKFEAAMDDDLNTPLALSIFYGFISDCNKLLAINHIDSKSAHSILTLWKKINSVFGFILSGQAEIPEEIKLLVKQREEARNGKDFKKSDDLRALIEKHGFILEDTKDGQKIRLAS